MTAAAYARYSTNLQTDMSIEAQLKGIKSYCVAHGITLHSQPYIDRAETGSNTDRAGFGQLIVDAQRGGFDAVIIYDVTRGSRDVADWFQFRRTMQRLGIKVLSVTDRLGDLDDPADFLGELLTVGIGQHHLLTSRKKSIAGKTVRAQKGLFCGGIAPLGYDIVDGRYVINEREAEAVKMIFEMYAAGSTYSKIIEAVDKLGVTGKKGQKIAPNTLHFILKNERYAGKFKWFEYEMRHMHKWVGRKTDMAIEIENGIPRIVSPETWAIVKKRMEDNKKNRVNKGKRSYLLSGLVVCEKCGSPMSGLATMAKGVERRSYMCLNKQRHKGCDAKNMRSEKLEDFILDLIKTKVLGAKHIESMADSVMEIINAPNDFADRLSKELAMVERKIGNLIRAIENGLDIEETHNRIAELKGQKAKLEKQIAESVVEVDIDRNTVVALLQEDARKLLDAPEMAATFVRKYIHKVYIGEDRISIAVTSDALLGLKKPCSQRHDDVVSTVGSPGKNSVVLTIQVPRTQFAA